MNILAVISGGDAPGINAALYQFASRASQLGDTVLGARGGFPGLLNGQLEPVTPVALLPWLSLPGAYLQSSRVPVLAETDAQQKIEQILKQHAIDALLVFGGDGTLRHIPPLLSRWNIASVGIPTTIDNDVPGTELTLGFDSACNFAYAVIDGMRATGHALPGRIFTLETLGGYTGFLALEIARGAAADVVLVPEFSYDADQVSDRLKQAVERSGQALLVYTEFLPAKEELLDAIPRRTHIRIRSSNLGHAQRGGAPSHRDRALAAEMVSTGLDALHAGIKMGVVVVRDGVVRVHEGTLEGAPAKVPDRALYRLINGLETT